MTSHFIWSEWVEPSPFAHFIYSIPNAVYAAFKGSPLPTTACFLNRSDFGPQRTLGNVRVIFDVMTQGKEVLLTSNG